MDWRCCRELGTSSRPRARGSVPYLRGEGVEGVSLRSETSQFGRAFSFFPRFACRSRPFLLVIMNGTHSRGRGGFPVRNPSGQEGDRAHEIATPGRSGRSVLVLVLLATNFGFVQVPPASTSSPSLRSRHPSGEPPRTHDPRPRRHSQRQSRTTSSKRPNAWRHPFPTPQPSLYVLSPSRLDLSSPQDSPSPSPRLSPLVARGYSAHRRKAEIPDVEGEPPVPEGVGVSFTLPSPGRASTARALTNAISSTPPGPTRQLESKEGVSNNRLG